ncbi:unnamed protein product [Adineta steineri]|uniref:Transmembrane protein 231 n=1 Tax=Adineta steineri TaxID=433720 RepID=A0A818VY98_9BILA|nr:unnamed protein product [Adineta steineri]CAF0959686.1 unnamed protein product [Adineta steineri]CAF3717691.1 unnamed protein product [Adineta steineri]
MVLYKVHSQEHRVRYFARPCSSAFLFQIVCIIFTILPPLFTSYFTSGFYYKELSYSEQPSVSFNGKYEIFIDSSSTSLFSSSDPFLNGKLISSYRSSTLRTSIPRDIDGDGLIDQFTITLNIILLESIASTTTNLWLQFQYALSRYPLLNMEALGVILLKAPSSLQNNSTVTIYGQLRLQQRQPLSSNSDYSSIQGSIINYGTYSTVPSFDDILNNYTSRNYYTTFDQNYVQWSSIPSTQQQLTIKIIVNNDLQSIRYIPNYWKEFRWAWIQYITALIPFFYIINKVKEFVFSNGLVRTVIHKSS